MAVIRVEIVPKVRSIVAAFVGMVGAGKDSPLGGMDYSAPEANAYEFQSGSIVDMLKKLQDQFREKLGESQKEEMNSKHASAMIVQDRNRSASAASRAGVIGGHEPCHHRESCERARQRSESRGHDSWRAREMWRSLRLAMSRARLILFASGCSC